MQHRHNNVSQEVAAAKAGVSVRSGRRIEKSATQPRAKTERDCLATLLPRGAQLRAYRVPPE